MKSLLILIRVMVAISMPAAGFFFFLTVESIQWVISAPRGNRMYRIEKMAEKEPSDVNRARLEGAQEIAKSVKWVGSYYATACVTGWLSSTIVCALSMWAGRKVKRLMQLPAALEARMSASAYP